MNWRLKGSGGLSDGETFTCGPDFKTKHNAIFCCTEYFELIFYFNDAVEQGLDKF